MKKNEAIKTYMYIDASEKSNTPKKHTNTFNPSICVYLSLPRICASVNNNNKKYSAKCGSLFGA